MSDDKHIDPWERQPNEPAGLFEKFKVFLTLPPPRRLKIVSELTGLGHAYVCNASSRHNWYDRAAAYDRFMWLAEVKAMREEREEASKQQVAAIKSAHQILFAKILRTQKQIAKDTERKRFKTLDNIDIIQAVRALESITKTWSLKMGEATERVDRMRMRERGASKLDFSGLTIEEIESIEKALPALIKVGLVVTDPSEPTGEDDDDFE